MTEQDITTTRPSEDARSLAKHLSELAEEATTLFRKEVELARSEVKESIAELKRGVTLVGSAGAVAYAGGLLVLGAITIFLGQFMELYLSALIVGVVTLGVAYFMYARGKEEVRPKNLVPRRAFRSVKETPSMVERPA